MKLSAELVADGISNTVNIKRHYTIASLIESEKIPYRIQMIETTSLIIYTEQSKLYNIQNWSRKLATEDAEMEENLFWCKHLFLPLRHWWQSTVAIK